ncbi:20280_t:CDS:2, partial [Gigaspora margarita]
IMEKLPAQTDHQEEVAVAWQSFLSNDPDKETPGWPTKESEGSDKEMSDSRHSSWEYNEEFTSKTLESEGQQEALIQQLAYKLWAKTTWTR